MHLCRTCVMTCAPLGCDNCIVCVHMSKIPVRANDHSTEGPRPTIRSNTESFAPPPARTDAQEEIMDIDKVPCSRNPSERPQRSDPGTSGWRSGRPSARERSSIPPKKIIQCQATLTAKEPEPHGERQAGQGDRAPRPIGQGPIQRKPGDGRGETSRAPRLKKNHPFRPKSGRQRIWRQGGLSFRSAQVQPLERGPGGWEGVSFRAC